MNMNDYLTMSTSDFVDGSTAQGLRIAGLVLLAIVVIVVIVEGMSYIWGNNGGSLEAILFTLLVATMVIPLLLSARCPDVSVSDLNTTYGITMLTDDHGNRTATEKSKSGEIIVLPGGIDTDASFDLSGDQRYDIAYVKRGAHEVSKGMLISHDNRFGILENNADGTSTTLEPVKSHKNTGKSRKSINKRAGCYVKSYNADGSVKELAGDCGVGANH